MTAACQVCSGLGWVNDGLSDGLVACPRGCPDHFQPVETSLERRVRANDLAWAARMGRFEVAARAAYTADGGRAGDWPTDKPEVRGRYYRIAAAVLNTIPGAPS